MSNLQDDVIASLLEELGQKQGYNTTDNNNKNDHNNNDNNNNSKNSEPNYYQEQTQQQLCLLPELSDYPNNSYCAGNKSIWNPYVRKEPEEKEDVARNLNHIAAVVLLATNPQVEIIRRRCYEKFKTEAQDNVTRIVFPQTRTMISTQSSTNTDAASTELLWKTSIKNLSTSVPGLFEKWHMDTKLQERVSLQQQQQQRLKQRKSVGSHEAEEEDDDKKQDCRQLFFDPNTTRIYQRTIEEKLSLQPPPRRTTQNHHHQQPQYYDPILPSKSGPSLFKSTFKVEMTKAILMTMKKKKKKSGIRGGSSSTGGGGGGGDDDDNNNNCQQEDLTMNLPNDVRRSLENKSKQIQKMLYKLVCQMWESFPNQLQKAAALQQQQQQSASQSSRGKKRSRKQQQRSQQQQQQQLFKIQVSTINDDRDGDQQQQIQIMYLGLSYRIHVAYYEKLQRLYDRSNNNNNNNQRSYVTSKSEYQNQFHSELFCILCRYDMLQGSGLQAAIPGRVMDTLLTEFDCHFECFASPLNCRYESYASAFEFDQVFGSIGNFFDIDFTNAQGGGGRGGCYEANPPFTEEVICKMNKKIQYSLQRMSSPNKEERTETTSTDEEETDDRLTVPPPLMFIVFVPAWKSSKAYQGLLENPFLTHRLILEQGKHWYTEGTQHRRKQSFRLASFDTAVLFYQNSTAQTKWPVTETKLNLLKEAFCEDPGIMDKRTTASSELTRHSDQEDKIGSGTAQAASAPPPRLATGGPSKAVKSKVKIGDELQQRFKEDGMSAERGEVITTHDRDSGGSQKKKKKKRARQKEQLEIGNRKRKQWIGGTDESTAQLDLLQSLGLSSSPKSNAKHSDNPARAKKKRTTKARK